MKTAIVVFSTVAKHVVKLQ